jgi:hypothetical protein
MKIKIFQKQKDRVFYTKAFLNAGSFLHFSNASSIWASSSNGILGN